MNIDSSISMGARVLPLFTAVMAFATAPALAQEAPADSDEQPCEFTFVPEHPEQGTSGDHMVPGHMQISPGCEFFYFPGMDEKELTSNPDLWNYTGGKSHFRITPDGKLLFMVNKNQSQASSAKTQPIPPPQPTTEAATGQPAAEAQEQAEPQTPIQATEKRSVAIQQAASKQNAALAAENRALRSQLSRLKQDLERRNREIATLQAEAQNKLAELKALDQSLQQNLNTAERKLAELSDELKASKRRNDNCTTLLDAQKRKNEQLQPQLADLQTRLDKALAGIRDDDGDGVPNLRDRCPGTPAGMATDAQGCIKLDLPGVNFATGSAKLNWKSRALLDHAAGLLKNLDVTLEIQGHTDNRGDPTANLALSQRRAEAVATYLKSRGVKAELLVPRGYGDQRPVADNGTPQGRAQNRRVTLVRLLNEPRAPAHSAR